MAYSSKLVTAVQGALVGLGWSISVDGEWGPATQGAVADFQANNGLVDGNGVASAQIDAATLTALGLDASGTPLPTLGPPASAYTPDAGKLFGLPRPVAIIGMLAAAYFLTRE